MSTLLDWYMNPELISFDPVNSNIDTKLNTGLVNQVAETILYGFNRHYTRFEEITRDAKTRFENADWDGEVQARKERIYFYDQRVNETVDYINENLNLESLDKSLWQDIKRQYLWLLYEHKQPELAESFYNSVFCRFFDRSYFNNRHIFVKPGTAIDFLDMDDPAYTSYYPDDSGLRDSFTNILQSFDLKNDWEDIERDLGLLTENFEPHLESTIKPSPIVNYRLSPLFSFVTRPLM